MNRRPLGRLATVVAVAGVASVVLALVLVGVREPAMHAALVAAGIVVAGALLGRAAAMFTPAEGPFLADPEPARSEAPEIARLRAIDTDLRMAAASRFGLETRLRTTLRDIAAWRLVRNHGIELDSASDASRRLVGDRLWGLIQPRAGDSDIEAPGVSLAEVEAAIDELERL